MSLFRPLPPVISVSDRPPRRLCPVSFVTASLASLLFLKFRHQKGFPVVNHCVHNHIENGLQQWVALGDPPLSAEGCSVVLSRLHHHLQPLPVTSEEAKGPGTCAITLQDTQVPGPVQGILCHEHVQEYCTEDLFYKGLNLLSSMYLQGC